MSIPPYPPNNYMSIITAHLMLYIVLTQPYPRFKREDYVVGRQAKWLEADGNQVKYKRAHGKLTERNFIRGSQYKKPEEAEAE